MCQWKSAIISRSGEIYHHPLVDSHNDLIDLFNLQDGKNPQFTPIEFLPGKDWFDVDAYKFTFDAERPDWADDDWVESATRKLKSIIKGMIVNEPVKLLAGGAYLIGPKAKITKIVSGRILAVDPRANLYGANLYGADLYGANLSRADLSRANLYGAIMSGADLSEANIDKKYCFLSISPIGSENGCLWVMREEDGILKYNRGCFSGTEEDFRLAVLKKHAGTEYEKKYFAAIDFIKNQIEE